MRRSSSSKSKPKPQDIESIHDLAKDGHLAEMQARHALGVPMDVPDAAGDTPLLFAVFNCQGDVWRWLLSVGANPAQVNAKGNTVIHHLTRRFKSGGVEATVQDFLYLVEAGAPVDGVNQEGYSPLLLESRRGQGLNTARDDGKEPRMAFLLEMARAGADVLRRAPDGLDMSDIFDQEQHSRLLALHRVDQVNGNSDVAAPPIKRLRRRT
jgi:ankyrin repeat protein